MATTHTEVYRGFKGELSSHPFRWLPLFFSEFRVATRKKLPLLLLYGPVAISTIVAMVMVYLLYTVESIESSMQESSGQFDLGRDMAAGMAMATIKTLLEVRAFIVEFYEGMSFFCLLAAAWFGAGLICEDRRVNAHLLYFSRPLNRLHYFFGKFITVASFAAFAMLVPGLLICLMAVMNSPDYAFVTEQGDVIVYSTLYALLWITSTSIFVLAISSLAPKKLFALVGVFGFYIFSQMGVEIALEIGEIEFLRYFSPSGNLLEIAGWMLARPGAEFSDEVLYSFLGLGAMLLVAILVLARRLKSMELSV